MATTPLDSIVYGDLWASPPLRALFEERPRMRAWLEILAVLAETQAEMGVIPEAAGPAIAAACRGLEVDDAFLRQVAAGRAQSGHSTWGLIEAIRARCPSDSGEWVHYGATVQDLSDTWLMAALREARGSLEADLRGVAQALRKLALKHRDTIMAGRTHGQPGLPITFGFKAAGWLVEVRRHLARLRQVAERLEVGQLSGGVGSLSALGPRGLEVQARFCARLGLGEPAISWTSSRDTVAEWGAILTFVTGTADRLGREVYNLQRPELGELSERVPAGTVGSVTMPHKRNPELAEHLGTLARLVRHGAAVLAEGQVWEHERDGRSWKAEWHVVPEVTLFAGQAVRCLRTLLEGLEVNEARMRANLEATRGFVLSEAVMLALAERVGRQSAHQLVYDVAVAARESGDSLRDAVVGSEIIGRHLGRAELDALFDYGRHTGLCGAQVDAVLASEEC